MAGRICYRFWLHVFSEISTPPPSTSLVFSLFYFFTFFFFLFFFSFYSRKLGQWLFGRSRFRTLQKNQRMLERTNERTRFIFKNYSGETYQLTSSFLSIYVPNNSTSYDIVLCIEIKGFSCKSLYKQVDEKTCLSSLIRLFVLYERC